MLAVIGEPWVTLICVSVALLITIPGYRLLFGEWPWDDAPWKHK